MLLKYHLNGAEFRQKISHVNSPFYQSGHFDYCLSILSWMKCMKGGNNFKIH